jgi:hypothetical protein
VELEDTPVVEPDSTEADSDLFVAEDGNAVAAMDGLEGWAEDTAPALIAAAEIETGLPDALAQAEVDEPATEPSAIEANPAGAVAAEAIEEAPEPLHQPELAAEPDDSFASPPVIAATLQEIDGEPRWVFARKPTAVPRIAEIDALSFEDKSVYFA